MSVTAWLPTEIVTGHVRSSTRRAGFIERCFRAVCVTQRRVRHVVFG